MRPHRDDKAIIRCTALTRLERQKNGTCIKCDFLRINAFFMQVTLSRCNQNRETPFRVSWFVSGLRAVCCFYANKQYYLRL